MAKRANKPSQAVADFLKNLPDDRRAAASRVREAIVRALPEGYEEAVGKRMLVYQVPLSTYPDTYNKQPLWYAALASEKSYLSLHLMPVYGDQKLAARLKAGFKAAGKKLDMGKACIHFSHADDLALDVIEEIVGTIPVARWVSIAREARRR